MKSKLITSLIVGMVLWSSFAWGARAQTPTIEVTPTDTPAIQVHLDIEPVTSSSEIISAVTLEPTRLPMPTATERPEAKAADEGVNTFFWALAVILGASILWLIGELLGPSTPLRASPTKKDEESQDI